jgi:hypothetical protein
MRYRAPLQYRRSVPKARETPRAPVARKPATASTRADVEATVRTTGSSGVMTLAFCRWKSGRLVVLRPKASRIRKFNDADYIWARCPVSRPWILAGRGRRNAAERGNNFTRISVVGPFTRSWCAKDLCMPLSAHRAHAWIRALQDWVPRIGSAIGLSGFELVPRSLALEAMAAGS